MRAWKVNEFGDAGDVVRLDENADSPELKRGRVRVVVEAAGLGLPDVLMCNNNYPLTPKLPFVPSQEAAGVVVAVGEGVDPSLIGQRVLGSTLFQEGHGGLADECLMDARSVFPIPEGMSSEEAAGFFIPFQTAWIGLVHRAKLTDQDTVLVLGASGSSGSAAVQLAKAKGARVIAVAGGPEKKKFCEEIGADAVIDHRAEDITARARELTDGRGVNVVFDPVGGKPGRAAFKAIAFEGRFVVIGYASGEWARIGLAETLMTNVSLLGAMPVGYSREFLEASNHDLMLHWQKGELKITGSRVFEFEDGGRAIEHIASGKAEGKVVVRIGPAGSRQ